MQTTLAELDREIAYYDKLVAAWDDIISSAYVKRAHYVERRDALVTRRDEDH